MFSCAYFQGSRYALQVFPHQPLVEERLVLLVLQVGQHHRLEERRVLPQQEVVQFVAGVLRVLRALLLRLQLVPVQNEPELHQVGIVAQRHHQRVDFGQAVVEFEAGRRDVFHAERLALIDDADLFLLREVLGGIESPGQPQIDTAACALRQARPSGRPCSADPRPRPTHAGTAASVCRSTVMTPFSSGTRFTSTAALWARKSRLADCTCAAAAASLGRRGRGRRLAARWLPLRTPHPLAPVAVRSPCRGWPTD